MLGQVQGRLPHTAGRRVDEDGLTGFEFGFFQGKICAQVGRGHGGGRGEAPPLWDGCHERAPGHGDRAEGPREDPHHPVARGEVLHVRADLQDHARALVADTSWFRVHPHGDQDVTEVDPGRADRDAYLVGGQGAVLLGGGNGGEPVDPARLAYFQFPVRATLRQVDAVVFRCGLGQSRHVRTTVTDGHARFVRRGGGPDEESVEPVGVQQEEASGVLGLCGGDQSPHRCPGQVHGFGFHGIVRKTYRVVRGDDDPGTAEAFVVHQHTKEGEQALEFGAHTGGCVPGPAAGGYHDQLRHGNAGLQRGLHIGDVGVPRHAFRAGGAHGQPRVGDDCVRTLLGLGNGHFRPVLLEESGWFGGHRGLAHSETVDRQNRVTVGVCVDHRPCVGGGSPGPDP